MTSSSDLSSTGKAPDQESALSTTGSGGDGGSWLVKLPGFAQADLNALMGRERLSQALDLEQKPDNRYLRLSLYFLGGAAALFIPLAALTPITQVVQASGQVVPKGAVNVIQHLEGGIVAKVNVLDGEQVKKGQVLLELNPQLVGSAYDAADQELENLVLQQKQLQAAKLWAVKTACSKTVQQCAYGVNSAQLTATKTSCSEGSFCVQMPSLSLYPPRPRLQASEKLHIIAQSGF